MWLICPYNKSKIISREFIINTKINKWPISIKPTLFTVRLRKEQHHRNSSCLSLSETIHFDDSAKLLPNGQQATTKVNSPPSEDIHSVD